MIVFHGKYSRFVNIKYEMYFYVLNKMVKKYSYFIYIYICI
jgi:hypothetical protein